MSDWLFGEASEAKPKISKVTKYGRQATSAVPRISIVRSKTSSSAASVRARLGLSVRSVNAEPEDEIFKKPKGMGMERNKEPSPQLRPRATEQEAIASPLSESATPQRYGWGSLQHANL